MIQTLITNNTHTPTRVGWRTGCSTQVGPGESQLVDGTPFEFRNEREVTALKERIKRGHISIDYVVGDDINVISLEVAAQKVSKSRAKATAAAAAKVTTATPVEPVVPVVPAAAVVADDNPNPNAGNDSLIQGGSIEDSKPKVGHKLPGTENDVVLDGPDKTVGLFDDLPPMTAQAQAHIAKEKITREQLQGIADVKGTGDKGAITEEDLLEFLNPTPPALPELSAGAAKLAKEAKLTDDDIRAITPTGKNGIIKGDVEKFIDNKS